MAGISSTSASTSPRASTSARYRVLLYHSISQSFDLPPATTSVNHLTCPLLPHHQSELALVLEIELALALEIVAPGHHISWSFDLPTATTSVSHLTCPLLRYRSKTLFYRIELRVKLTFSQSRINSPSALSLRATNC